MNKHILFLGSILITLTALSQNRSINFEHSSFKDLKAKALKENKLIFIDAYTTWCGPCKYLSKTIFTNDSVADYYNSNFINAKFDMEKGEGIELAKNYSVMCYPNLLFIDGNGNLIHRVAGSMNAKMIVELGKTAKDPHQNFSYYKTNYATKKADADFLIKYIELISGTCLESTQELATYFLTQKEENLSNDQNWKMIDSYTQDMDSREFTYLLNNKSKFEMLYSTKAVDEKITSVAQQSLNNIIRSKNLDAVKYAEAKKKIMVMNLPMGNQIIFESDLSVAKNNKDWKTYESVALKNVDIYYLNNSNELNSVAWDFYENVTDKTSLLKAEEWAKNSVELEPMYANLDTYASLLYKNDKKDLALTTADKAIEYAKNEGYAAADYKSTTDLVAKIKLMK